jgi:hypothetical protein
MRRQFPKMDESEAQRRKRQTHGDLVDRVVAATGRSRAMVYAVLCGRAHSKIMEAAIDALRRGEQPPQVDPPPAAAPPRRKDWTTWNLSVIPDDILEYELAQRSAQAKRISRKQQPGKRPS